ncbi:MAG: hypothetical protein H6733_11880 [Alphaproteobacteria bacterium]|nr:hypothetical protein [Alphaproteobacteria bacterium]
MTVPMRPWMLASLVWSAAALAEEPAPADDDAEATEAAPEPSGPPAISSDEIRQIREEMERMRADLAEQKKQLDKQASELATQRKSLAEQRLKLASDDFKFELTGYYRVRGHVFGAGRVADGAEGPVAGALFQSQTTSGQYLNQRLRLGLKFAYKDVASLNVHMQALDDVIWGDNADVSSTPLFAGNPSYTQIDGTETPSFQVFRAWTQFRIPVGEIRVGRMASHWGLGILANDGDGFRNDFGEAHYGATFDRFLFATRPVNIAQAITKKEETKEIPLVLAIAFDRLVTDPLTQYYGFECRDGVTEGERGFDTRCDLDGDGITDVERDFDQDRTADQRQVDWWASQDDDVWEMVYALFYKGENVHYLGGVGDLFAGMYVINRIQRETDSNVWILDGSLDAQVHGLILQFEGLGIIGKTRALSLKGSDTEDPYAKKARLASYALRVGYQRPLVKFVAETGYASGDDQVNDANFTGRPMDPDYNVGLLLYEEILSRITRLKWDESASGLWSKGGVYNSYYLNPRLYLYPYNNTEIILGFLTAFPDRPDGAVVRCDQSDADKWGCIPVADKLSPVIGYEVDLAIKHTFDKYITASIETAYAHATDRLPLESTGLNTSGHFWTFQARAAWQF